MTRTGVLLLYVVPLLLTAAFLASVGLEVLAVALLGVEAVVAASVYAVRRRPRGPAVPRDGSTFLLLLGGGIVVVGLALTAVVLLGG